MKKFLACNAYKSDLFRADYLLTDPLSKRNADSKMMFGGSIHYRRRKERCAHERGRVYECKYNCYGCYDFHIDLLIQLLMKS